VFFVSQYVSSLLNNTKEVIFMDSGMIGKIEKAIMYAQEPERITFNTFAVTFKGDHKTHQISYDDRRWHCDCTFFQTRGVCSHVMTLERLLSGSVTPAEIVPAPA
jgi:hypothetical protein